MTRDQIVNVFQTRNGRIVSAGKFQGEPIYAPYFWESVLNGCCDEEVTLNDKPHNWFTVSDADRAEFPELAEIVMVVISESDNGFVTCVESNADELQAARAEESADCLNDETDAL